MDPHTEDELRRLWQLAPQADLKSALSTRINELIQADFAKLLYYFYRWDVSEKKVKDTLQTHPEEDAGILLADLVIDRMREKARSRADNQGLRPSPEDPDAW